MNFFAERYDVQVVLGLTLVGVPKSWDEITLVGFVKSYSYAFGPNEVGIVSTFIETTPDGIRMAHITCNNLYSKQKLLKIRLIPVIDGENEKFCQIITVRPYCFWIKLHTESPPVPFMLPKYGSRDVSYESVEAQMLLHKNNIHPSIVTCLMEFSLIPRDGSYWRASEAIPIWFDVKMKNETLFNFLETLLLKVQQAASTFVPYPYGIKDEVVYSSNWNQLLVPEQGTNGTQYFWPWEPIDAPSAGTGLERPEKRRKNVKKIGCIRWEMNRKRWVVDMSYSGKRLQKCFHETYYGIEGGLKEAMRWRLEFLKKAKATLSGDYELKVLADVLDKIMQMPVKDSKKQKLIDILKVPLDGVAKVVTPEQILLMIYKRLNRKEPIEEPSADSDGGSSNTEAEHTEGTGDIEIADEAGKTTEGQPDATEGTEGPKEPQSYGNNGDSDRAPAEKEAVRNSFRMELRKTRRIWDPDFYDQ